MTSNPEDVGARTRPPHAKGAVLLPATGTAKSGDKTSDDGVGLLRRRILQVAVPGGVATALLYYWGWASTVAFYRQVGVGHTSLEFSTADYVLRSLDVIVNPLPDIFTLAVGAAVIVAGLMVVVQFLPLWLGRYLTALVLLAGGTAFVVSRLVDANAMIGNRIGVDFDPVLTELIRLTCLVLIVAAGYLLASRPHLRRAKRPSSNRATHTRIGAVRRWWRRPRDRARGIAARFEAYGETGRRLAGLRHEAWGGVSGGLVSLGPW